MRTEHPRSARRWPAALVWVTVAAVLAAAFFSGLFAVSGGRLEAPDWVLTRLEHRVNRDLARGVTAVTAGGSGAGEQDVIGQDANGQDTARLGPPGTAPASRIALGRIALGGVSLALGDDWVPRLTLRDVNLYLRDGRLLAQLPDVRAQLDGQALLFGSVQPVGLVISGARVTLRRAAGGALDVDLAADMAGPPMPAPPASPVSGSRGAPQGSDLATTDPLLAVLGMIEAAEQMFAAPGLAGIARIEARDLTVVLRDARAERVWTASGGHLVLTQTARDLALAVELALPGADGTDLPARAELTLALRRDTRAAHLSATVSNVRSADIATQSAALAWLAVLDAPISGSFTADLDGAAQVASVSGGLTLGAGAVRPVPQARPVPFDGASLAFAYDPAAGRIDFSDLSFVSGQVHLRAEGRAYLADVVAGLPRTVLGQIRLREVTLDPDGIFETPVTFSDGALDLKLALDPFRLTIGQLVLTNGDRRIAVTGRVGVAAQGWEVALDGTLNAITRDALLALWPEPAVPLTRRWIATNLTSADLFNATGAVRISPGTRPRISLGWEFTDAQVRFLPTLPPIAGAAGRAVINADAFAVVLDQGRIMAPDGGAIDVAGTVFRVPDLRVKPSPAVVDLNTRSSVTAALSLLDQPPFRFLTKAGRPVDLAEGTVAASGEIMVRLGGPVAPGDADFRIEAAVRDAVSDRLVPGRVLRAAELQVSATPAGLRISGPGTLDGVAASATWQQDFGPAAAGRSTVAGTVELSRDFVDAFGIGLPEGSVSGRGKADLALNIAPGRAPTFRLTSALQGVGLRLPQIGWEKLPETAATLTVEGSLGAPPVIDVLTLDAPGLRVTGKVALAGDGGRPVATFSRVQAGNWLDAPVTLTGQGAGQPVAVAIRGGALDLRQTRFDTAGSDADGGPVSLALDRLIVSEGIALTDFAGEFRSNGGFKGDFSASVNDAAAVTGAVGPSGNGTAVRLQSGDAGAVFRAAGVFDRARGGGLDLTLVPDGAPGSFDGRLRVANTRVRDAPVLAELLGAISVVGLLEQLDGEGLAFSDVQAEFRLTPSAVEVISASAVGSSLGVSMAGVYDLASKRIDMRGVISPIYLLNGIGSFLTRRGEGLFGFNYDLTGTAAAPRVSVNPLSILTPGMFREIFRGAPPKPSQ